MSECGSCSDCMKAGVLRENPILRHALGICSALAVTGFVSTTLVMCAALLFVSSLSCAGVSLIRHLIPRRVRLIAEMFVISLLVIIVHLFLKAYFYDMSKALGPYVGLIITNCIILGRCEGFAMRNDPLPSFFDGLGAALGYSLVLLFVALIREPLGYGTLLGYSVMPEDYLPNLFVSSVPGAFIAMGVVVWIVVALAGRESAEHPEANYNE